MNAIAERNEFAPPPTPGWLRALTLALAAHLLLVLGLTAGLSWKRNAVSLTAEAELWSAVPMQAAPPLVAPPPEPEPVQQEAVPPPEPQPSPAREKAEPDINLEELKKQKAAKEKEKEKEKARQEQLKAEALAKLKAEKLKKEKLASEKAQQMEMEAATEKKKKELEAKRKKAEKEQRDVQLSEAQRLENIKRLAALAGAPGVAAATGSNHATGTAQQASGPSASYGGRIRARIKPNIVYADDTAGNPTAEVEVRTAADGTIVSRKLLKPSGNANWDQAVLKAIDKTEVLPRDENGTVPGALVISFRPKD